MKGKKFSRDPLTSRGDILRYFHTENCAPLETRGRTLVGVDEWSWSKAQALERLDPKGISHKPRVKNQFLGYCPGGHTEIHAIAETENKIVGSCHCSTRWFFVYKKKKRAKRKESPKKDKEVTTNATTQQTTTLNEILQSQLIEKKY